MSDTNGTVASSELLVAPTSGTAAPNTISAKAEPEGEPSWLNARLDRERQSLLKKTGFESVEAAQAAATELKAKREAEKSATEKAAEALARATAAEGSATALRAAVSDFAVLQMGGLTPEQKEAVNMIAGDDPAQQLKAIAALAPTWTTPAATKAASVDTAPAANAPAATVISPTDHRAQYDALKKTNAFAAAAYAIEHSRDIYGA